MKNDTKIVDKYFEEARNSQQLFPIDQARNILEDHIAGNASNSKNLWKKIIGKPMNIITTTAASVALIGILSLGIINYDKQSNNTETKQLSNDNNTQIITTDETPTTSNNDLADKNPEQKTTDIAVIKEEISDDQETIKVNVPEHEKVNIKGINVIQLSKDELADLGIEIIKDDSNTFGDQNERSKYGLAYCDNWLNDEPVRTVVMKDWGVVRNNDWETPDTDNCLSPRIITDNKGNRRVEVFNDQEYLTTKTYYNNFEDVHKDEAGNEMKIKTNQTTTSYHFKDKENSDIEKEITTELMITKDDDYVSKEPRVIVMSNNVDVDSNYSNNPMHSAIVIVNVDSANKYINSTGDTNILRSVFVLDKNRMDDLDIKLKKFNLEWHEEQLDELKERLVEINEQQKQHQDNMNESKKLIKLYSDTNFTKEFKLDSNYKKMIMEFNGDINFDNMDQLKQYKLLIDPNNLKFKIPEFDSLKIAPSLYSDSIIKKHIDIDFDDINGMDTQFDNSKQLVFIKQFNNIERDINNYIRVNKMIPIEVPIKEDDDDFSFILWFDATPELLQKLPARVSDMLELELDALQNTSDVCQTPIKGEEAILDIWRSCSGAIENLHVFPNPTTGEASLQFNLTEPRDLKITLNDLYGRSIKGLSNFHKENAGLIKQSIDLSDLPAGMYLIAVESKNGEQAVQRIIVE